MKIADVMTRNPEIVAPEEPIREAARMMLDADTGALPVGDRERLVGMVTDRDITVRAVAEGRGPDTPVKFVMSDRLLFAWDDQDVDEVAMQMSDAEIRRVPVLKRGSERLVGIVSLRDLSRSEEEASEGKSLRAEAVSGNAEPIARWPIS